MQFLQQTLRQRFACATCAVALVCSLTVYQRDVTANPLSVARKHWDAIAAAAPERAAIQYSNNAVLVRSYGALDEVYQGKSIYSAWQQFFADYQLKDFQVVKQQQRDRAVEAEIAITAKSRQGNIVVFRVFYQVHFDEAGKITREVWQANPGLSV